MSSAICFNLDQYKILSSGNGLESRETSWKNEKMLVGGIFFTVFSNALYIGAIKTQVCVEKG